MSLWQLPPPSTLPAAGLLTHELQSACAVAKRLQGLRVVGLGTAEVHNLKGVVSGQQQVVRLDVQVEHVVAMEVVQALQQLHHIGGHVIFGIPESRVGVGR